jgi:hypothetical protein
MSDGQLAMNTNLASPGLFFKDSNGDLVKVGPVHVGTTAPNATPGAGGQAGNSKGELWLDTSGSDYTLKTWDGSAWREIVVTSAMIKDGTIVNADINASAAIAHTKLANITAGSVLLGNASNVPTATALSGDVTVSDAGVTAIGSGVIVDADVNASADIAGTKINPDFGSQALSTTGLISANGKVSFPLGTAALPSLFPGTDTNTGIYSPGADQVAISINGTETCRIANEEGLSINTFSANPGVDNTNVGIQLRTNGAFRASAGTFHSFNRNAVSRSNQPILEYRLEGSLVGTIRDYNSGDGIGFVADGTEKLYLEGDQVRSETIYAATSVSAANIFINSVGRMMQSTSSLKYKKDVEDLDPTYSYKVLNELRPVWYRAKERPDMDEDARPTDSYWGLIAEEVHEVDPRLVNYAVREEGKREPEGVQYDRIIPHLLVVVKQQQTEINELKAQLAQLSS